MACVAFRILGESLVYGGSLSSAMGVLWEKGRCWVGEVRRGASGAEKTVVMRAATLGR